MNHTKRNAAISRSLLVAWAALLACILGLLTWVVVFPYTPPSPVEDISGTIDLQLPEAMPVDQIILKDKETTEDTGGAASATQADGAIHMAGALLEQSKHGPIPKVGGDGRRPSQVYAAKIKEVTEGKIKVAFIFSDLGRNKGLHDKILEQTPPGVTFAYLPYGEDIKSQMTAARAKGHEILLNIPMEPGDFPTTETGPNTLLTGIDPKSNIDRLHWAMAQGHEYIGLMNLQGSLFLASDKDLHPILSETQKRGLIFAEAEACFRSQAYTGAQRLNLPYLKSEFVLDESLTPAEVQKILIRAEQQAQETGFISIVAHTSPLNAPTLLAWIKKAQEENYVFVPVSGSAGVPS